MKKVLAFLLPLLLLLSLASCTLPGGESKGGLSAYEIAVENGYTGDESSWLESLKGDDLTLSAVYAAAKEAGYEGDLLSFLKEYLSYDDGDLAQAGVTPASAKLSSSLLASVSVTCTFEYQVTSYGGWFGMGGGGTSTKTATQSGSGVIYRMNKETGDAYIITNYHVVYYYASLTEDKISDEIKVYLYGSESERYAIGATYVGGSMNYDIAILKVTGSEVLKNSSALAVTVADSNLLTVGDTAIAIGNAEGEGISVTRGVVSVDSEYIQMQACDNVSIVSYRLLRVDSAINSGNSGGGLFGEDGRLIGIVNAKVSSSSVENIGYAIPSNIATYVADNIIETCDGETVTSPKKCMLGITLGVSGSAAYFDPETGTARIRETVYLTGIQSGKPADGVLKTGDVITAITIGDQTYTIDRSYIAVDIMLTCRVGDTVKVSYLRDGVPGTANFTLDESSLVTVN